jgi:hypothetical protein
VNLRIPSNYLCYSLFCLRIHYPKSPNAPPSARQDEELHRVRYSSQCKLYHNHTTPGFSFTRSFAPFSFSVYPVPVAQQRDTYRSNTRKSQVHINSPSSIIASSLISPRRHLEALPFANRFGILTRYSTGMCTRNTSLCLSSRGFDVCWRLEIGRWMTRYITCLHAPFRVACGAEGEEKHMRSYAQSKITELAIFVDLALPSSVSNVSQTSLFLPGSGMS